jgi:GxxExxY protein
VIAAAIEVHRILGPGPLESTYMTCLRYELSPRKLRFVAQEKLPLVYKGIVLDASYRLDLVVADTVVVEVKSVVKHEPVYDAQVLTLPESQWASRRPPHQLQCPEARGRCPTHHQPIVAARRDDRASSVM